MIHYVYLTTNLINGKQYVGDHTINNKQKDYYIGSGIALIKAVKKYGENNFFKEILEWYPTKQEAFDAQEKYIIKYNTLIPNGYNISPKGGLRVKGCHSEETKQKIANSNRNKKRSEESKKKMSESQKTREIPGHYNPLTLTQKQHIIYLHLIFKRGICEIAKTLNISVNTIKGFLRKRKIYLGRIYSEENKKKLSQKRKGVKRSPETCKKMSDAIKGHLSPMKEKTYEEMYGEEKAKKIKSQIRKSNTNKKRTKEQRENISKSLKGKKHSEEHKKNNSLAHMGNPSPNKGKHYFINEKGKRQIIK